MGRIKLKINAAGALVPFFILFWLQSQHISFAIVMHPTVEIPAHSSYRNGVATQSSVEIGGYNLLAAIESDSAMKNLSGLQVDQVVRVLDANSIKLKKNGIVSLAGVRMPTPKSSGFQFPECLTYTPAYKVRQLLPINSNVLVKVASATSSGKSAQAIIVRSEDKLIVNQELIRSGFGRVQKVASDDLKGYLDMDRMQSYQNRAKDDGLGIFKRCDASQSEMFEAQFEPLELTVETQWGDDGGKSVIRSKDAKPSIPTNPGDIRGKLVYFDRSSWCLSTYLLPELKHQLIPDFVGCSDFSTYEDALRWYEQFLPFYGDVAKLDRDGDGVPCPGLPHTKVAEKYRMKVPTTTRS